MKKSWDAPSDCASLMRFRSGHQDFQAVPSIWVVWYVGCQPYASKTSSDYHTNCRTEFGNCVQDFPVPLGSDNSEVTFRSHLIMMTFSSTANCKCVKDGICQSAFDWCCPSNSYSECNQHEPAKFDSNGCCYRLMQTIIVLNRVVYMKGVACRF